MMPTSKLARQEVRLLIPDDTMSSPSSGTQIFCPGPNSDLGRMYYEQSRSSDKGSVFDQV